MVKFLIHRPIAVLMTFLALVIVGVIASRQLPVSLLPDINIPEITVHVSHPDFTARELETHVTKGLRWQLKQCSGIDEIVSETRDGYAILRMRFKYGTDSDLAAIDVNEKIDRAMNFLPREMTRPRVIKASATDIPVMYLNVNLKDGNENYSFLDLSAFTHNVIRKRIEQLKEVALVDITGVDKPEIVVEPEAYKMQTLGIDNETLNNIFRINNLQLGNITVKDGFYQYNIRFSSQLNSAGDLANMYIKTGPKIVQLKDVARVETRTRKKNGFFTVNGQKGISMAVIKQSDARMQDLRDELDKISVQMTRDYPEIEFTWAQDQSALLEYSIQNLESSLLIGGILAFLVVFLFMSNARLPVLIILTVPISVIISLLFFMLLGISINIISLSGLILGLGLMIDNAIIMIDNISQFRERGNSIGDACVMGANEVIRPLLSSALTTAAVFVPLVFISGLAGALFYDQAITVSIGLGVSFIVSITLLPVLYYLFFKRSKQIPGAITSKRFPAEKVYNKGFDLVFKYKKTSAFISLGCIAAVYYLFLLIEKENFPPYPQKDVALRIDWNENISTETNAQRVGKILNANTRSIVQTNTWIGEQDYLLNADLNVSSSEAKVYVECHSPQELAGLKQDISQRMKQYPDAKYDFESPDNIFEKTFSNKEPSFILKLHQDSQNPDYEKISEWFGLVAGKAGFLTTNEIAYEKYISFMPDFEKIVLYNLSVDDIYAALKTIFNENQIGTIKTSAEVAPVTLTSGDVNFMEKLKEARVRNKDDALISLLDVVEMKEVDDFKKIMADINHEYVPVEFDVSSGEAQRLEASIKNLFKQYPDIDFSFGGAIYKFRRYLGELLIVLAISLMLLYFILAAQFESMVQPLIILLEIPIDVAGALLVLMLFGSSLNIMSAIGIIVMTGIVINDSILKIDTINRLRREEGMSILDAIHEGGKRRLRPIVMTSLTTILAVTPVVFGSDLGSEMQKPLALAIGGGLFFGTIVSLYFIPLVYWVIYHRSTLKV